jgi:hypothetical protein
MRMKQKGGEFQHKNRLRKFLEDEKFLGKEKFVSHKELPQDCGESFLIQWVPKVLRNTDDFFIKLNFGDQYSLSMLEKKAQAAEFADFKIVVKIEGDISFLRQDLEAQLWNFRELAMNNFQIKNSDNITETQSKMHLFRELLERLTENERDELKSDGEWEEMDWSKDAIKRLSKKLIKRKIAAGRIQKKTEEALQKKLIDKSKEKKDQQKKEQEKKEAKKEQAKKEQRVEVAASTSTQEPVQASSRLYCRFCKSKGVHLSKYCPYHECHHCKKKPAGHLEENCWEAPCLNATCTKKDQKHFIKDCISKGESDKYQSFYLSVSGIVNGKTVRVGLDTDSTVNLILDEIAPKHRKEAHHIVEGVGGGEEKVLGLADIQYKFSSLKLRRQALIVKKLPLPGVSAIIGMPTIFQLGMHIPPKKKRKSNR